MAAILPPPAGPVCSPSMALGGCYQTLLGNQTFTTNVNQTSLGNDAWLFGATADNATYTAASRRAPQHLPAGGRRRHADHRGRLFGTTANSVVIGGNNTFNAVTGSNGTVLITSAQSGLTGGITINNGGTLTVTSNGALGAGGATNNAITLQAGVLDLREASTNFGSGAVAGTNDTQYSARNLTITGALHAEREHLQRRPVWHD